MTVVSLVMQAVWWTSLPVATHIVCRRVDGVAFGSITECYATGSVKTETVDPYSLNIVGGLVGEGGNIRNCYATCIVIGGAPSNELGSNGVGRPFGLYQ